MTHWRRIQRSVVKMGWTHCSSWTHCNKLCGLMWCCWVMQYIRTPANGDLCGVYTGVQCACTRLSIVAYERLHIWQKLCEFVMRHPQKTIQANSVSTNSPIPLSDCGSISHCLPWLVSLRRRRRCLSLTIISWPLLQSVRRLHYGAGASWTPCMQDDQCGAWPSWAVTQYCVMKNTW